MPPKPVSASSAASGASNKGGAKQRAAGDGGGGGASAGDEAAAHAVAYKQSQSPIKDDLSALVTCLVRGMSHATRQAQMEPAPGGRSRPADLRGMAPLPRPVRARRAQPPPPALPGNAPPPGMHTRRSAPARGR